MKVPDEGDAVLVFSLVIDALATVTVDLDHHDRLPTEMHRGAVLLADELLRRVWPLVDKERIGVTATAVRAELAQCATGVRRDYHLDNVQ